MENQEVNPATQSTFTIAVLFGLWLQQKEQRKRLAKTEMVRLFDEWMNHILEEVQNAKD